MYVYGRNSCAANAYEQFYQWPCPQWNAKLPDSSSKGTATIGGAVIDLRNPESTSFGSPMENSILIDRIPFATVPADIYGNPRDGRPDVGAVERSGMVKNMLSPIILLLHDKSDT